MTIIGAISPAGGDMTEPVTTYTQRFVRCMWSLDRDLAYARHYPAVSWSGSFSRDDAVIAAWHARNGDPGWAQRRSQLAGLLAEADRLSSLAELMGTSALPAAERVMILAGHLIREGLLQQSALSPADASCGASRAAALASAVLTVAERCRALARSGVPATAIEEQDFSPIVRAREEAATPAAVKYAERVMLASLGQLDRDALPGEAQTAPAADHKASGAQAGPGHGEGSAT